MVIKGIVSPFILNIQANEDKTGDSLSKSRNLDKEVFQLQKNIPIYIDIREVELYKVAQKEGLAEGHE